MAKAKNNDRPDFLALVQDAKAAGMHQVLHDAQRAVAPEIGDLEKFIEQIRGYAPKFAAPTEPSIEECHVLDEQIVEAWRAGKDGRAIVDAYQHPWLESPERRQQFTAARYTRALITIQNELDAATRPSDDQIRWLNDELISAFKLTTQYSHDRNAEELWIERYSQLFAAWEGLIRKTSNGGVAGPLEVDAAALFSNAEDISPHHLGVLRGDPNPIDDPWFPRHTRDRALQLFNTPEAEVWLPTWDQWQAKRREIRDAEWDATQRRQDERPQSRRVSVGQRLR